jgi:hypothetical protein
MWHRVGPVGERRTSAPWKLTGIDGRTCFGRVQYQDGSWQGQVIVNSLPADWRRNNRGISYPSAWHNKRADAFSAVEDFLSRSVRSLFKADELSFLTWDDDDQEPDADKADKAKAEAYRQRFREESERHYKQWNDADKQWNEADIQRHRTEELRRITDRIAKESLKDDFAKWAKVQIPKALSDTEADMLKKYWG